MKAVTVRELSQELTYRTPKELRDLCLRLSRFKKENKELLTYLLFESSDELSYIAGVKKEMDEEFEQINKNNLVLYQKECQEDFKKYQEIHQVFAEETDRGRTASLFLYKAASTFPLHKKEHITHEPLQQTDRYYHKENTRFARRSAVRLR